MLYTMKYTHYTKFLIILLHLIISLASAGDNAHLVSNLPGQPKVEFKQFAGQISVDADRTLFYWFYEADHINSSALPLAIWFNGGPGCSSIGTGALLELGPFKTNNGTGLVLNEFSWNKVANLMFVESPSGVGFSYRNSSVGNDYSDEQTASEALIFILEWFKRFPEYSRNDFYLLGESYAGHYVPNLATKIVEYNKKKAGSHVNFKGFAVGNPWTDAFYDGKATIDFVHTHSIISEEIYKQIMEACYTGSNNASYCSSALNNMRINTQWINPYNIYAPSCNKEEMKVFKEFKQRLTMVYDPCLNVISPYLNSPEVQDALHVIKKPKTWSTCNQHIFFTYPEEDINKSMLPLYTQLLKEGLKIWIYSGDVDSVVPTIGTTRWITHLNLTIEQPWYAWKYQDQVGGWTQRYSGLTFATVREAGHLVPFDKPEQALIMFKHFLDGQPLPSF